VYIGPKNKAANELGIDKFEELMRIMRMCSVAIHPKPISLSLMEVQNVKSGVWVSRNPVNFHYRN